MPIQPGKGTPPAEGIEDLEARRARAIARAFLYRFLAKAYENPVISRWSWLAAADTQAALAAAARAFCLTESTGLADRASILAARLAPANFEPFKRDYLAAFGQAVRNRCPMNEIEYGDIRADPLFQPHRLTDLATFYQTFGLDLTGTAGERHDHICLELEFMAVLAAKEAFGFAQSLGEEPMAVGQAAQRQFLREHLGRWIPAFARRVAQTVPDGPLATLADFTADFITTECLRLGVAPGNDEVLLRSVNYGTETGLPSSDRERPEIDALGVEPRR